MWLRDDAEMPDVYLDAAPGAYIGSPFVRDRATIRSTTMNTLKNIRIVNLSGVFPLEVGNRRGFDAQTDLRLHQ
jgi:hypothetical protein